MNDIVRGMPSEDSGATLPFDAKDWQNQAHAEVVGLWDHAAITLESVSGVNVITATGDVTVPAYRTGMSFYFKPAANNTGPVTINIDSLGAKDLLTHEGKALGANDLLSGVLYSLYYDGTNMLASGGGIGDDAAEGAPTLLLNERITTDDDYSSGTPLHEVLAESFTFTTTEENQRVRFNIGIPIVVFTAASDNAARNAAVRVYLDGDDFNVIGSASQWNGEIIANAGQWCRYQNIPNDTFLACSVEKTIATSGVHTIRVHVAGSTTDVVGSLHGVRQYQVESIEAIKGETGERGMTHLGAYDAGTDYVQFDAVTYEGSTWIAKIATTGNAPPTLPTESNTQWQLVAKAGADGDDGLGVPAGGTTSQVLAKASGTDNDTEWVDPPSSGSVTVTRQIFTSSGTWNKPAGLLSATVDCYGGGGGSRGSTGDGGDGGDTTFDVMTAGGGKGGTATLFGLGGTATGGDINLSGQFGMPNDTVARLNVGGACHGPFGGHQAVSSPRDYGGGAGTGVIDQGGGGGGGYCSKHFDAGDLGATETVTVGSGGTAGAGSNSNAGAGGLVVVTSYIQS